MKDPRVAKVAPAEAEFSLVVTWEDGSTTIVSLADPIHRLKALARLRDPILFKRVEVADYGWAIRWPHAIDYSADSLWRLAQEQAGEAMSAKDFRSWRARNGLSLTAAADLIGLSRRMVAYYDSGEKPIPKAVWLACRYVDAARELAADRERRPKAAGSAKARAAK